MTKTAIIYSPKYLRHKTGPRHPEVPSRLRVILRELNKSGILENENCSLVEPETVNIKDLERVHNNELHSKNQTTSAAAAADYWIQGHGGFFRKL